MPEEANNTHKLSQDEIETVEYHFAEMAAHQTALNALVGHFCRLRKLPPTQEGYTLSPDRKEIVPKQTLMLG